MKGCGKKYDGWHHCGEYEQGSEIQCLCDDCKSTVKLEDGFYWVKFYNSNNRESFICDIVEVRGLNVFTSGSDERYRVDDSLNFDFGANPQPIPKPEWVKE